MARALSKRGKGVRKSTNAGTFVLSSAAAAALFTGGLTAKADITGFSGFSPVNTNSTAATDTNIGYQSGGTVFQLTSNINGEASSGFNPTAQNLSSFILTYTYQTIPQLAHGTGGTGNSLEADGATIAFQNAATGSTTALGAGGGGLGYTATTGPLATNSLAVANQLFDGYYSYGGGSQLGTNGSLGSLNSFSGVDVSSGDPLTIRLSYAGTTLAESVTDTTTGKASTVVYTGVNLASTLGSTSGIVGFTGGTGGYNATQKVSNFSLITTPTFTPIGITSGFTQNMIIPASAPQSGAASSITASMDQGTANTANNVWYEKGYNTAAPTTGLPTSGSTFTSQNDANHTFQMQSYTGAGDAVLLSNSTNDTNLTGTLTLSKVSAYRAISLLVASGNGPNYFNIIVNYSDGAASSTIPAVVAPDWFNANGGQVAYAANGRAVPDPTNATSFNNVNNTYPLLFQEDISLPDTADPISSITFNYSSGGGNTAIFAVSGVAASSSSLKYGGNDPTKPGQFDNGLTANFNNGTGSVAFINGDVAIFDDTATGTHTVSVASGGVIPASVIFNNNSSSYTINGPGAISGTGGLTVGGTGTVTLNNSNTYTGATSVTAGTLVLGATSSTASPVVTVGSSGTLNISSGAVLASSALILTDNGHINDFESLTLAGLTGTGAFNLSSTGLTLTLTGNAPAPATPFTGTVNGNGATLALAGTGGTFGGTFTATTGSTPNAAIVNTTGTWLLSGSNGYAGGTTLTAGVAQAATNNSFGTGTITFNGGSISSTVPISLSNVIAGTNVTVASGSNVVEFSNATNTFSGPVAVLGGTLKIDNQGGLGTSTVINVSNGGSFEVGTNTIGTGDTVNITGPGMTSTFATPIPNGPTGALRGPDYNSGTWAGSVVVSGSTYIDSGVDGTLTLTGAISGSGTVAFAGTTDDANGGLVVLAPAAGVSSTYSGETQIIPEVNTNTNNGMILRLGANNGISPNSGLNIIAGASPDVVEFDMAGYNQSVSYLVGLAQTGSLLTNSSGTLSTLTVSSGLKGGGPATFAVPITGNIAVVMNDPTGLGNQILTGNNSYAGGTTITKGTLTAASSTALSNTTVTLNGGTLGLAAANVTPGPSILTSSNFSNFTLNTTVATSPPVVSGNALTLTSSVNGVAVSAFNPVKVPVSDSLGFTVTFNYNVSSGYADGAAFVLQNDPRGANAIGAGGGELGYGGTTKITNSAAVLFNIYPFNSNGAGTALDYNGLVPGDTGDPQTKFTPTQPVNIALRPSGGVEYYDFQPVDVTLVYNGPAETLTETLYSDTEQQTFTTVYTGVDFSSLLGGTAGGSTTAYIGFTAGTGGVSSTQTITNFNYAANVNTPQSLTNAIVAAAGTTSAIQIDANAGSTTTAASIGSLTINAGATVNVTTPTGTVGRGVLTLPSGVSIATSNTGAFTGKLDVGANDLDFPTSSNMTLAQVTALVASGFNKGTWTGQGIASSAAAANTSHLTALGVITNDNGSGTPLYGAGGSLANNFDGSFPSDGDILVKYTYYGDANLDGAVDGSDYTLIDNGFHNHLTGWYNGDFNYDGVVDGSDYTLIDNAYNTQGASLGSNPAALVASSTAQISGGSSVPEPTTLGLVGVAAIGLLGKRRRRN